MKKKGVSQQELLRSARKRLDMTNAELADALGKSRSALEAWLMPDSAKSHRNMPASAKLLLQHVLLARRHTRK